jgi:hypothetical protein
MPVSNSAARAGVAQEATATNSTAASDLRLFEGKRGKVVFLKFLFSVFVSRPRGK